MGLFDRNNFLSTDDQEKATSEYFGGDEDVYKDTSTEYDGVDTNKPETRRGDSADEVDPRKLVRDPTLNEIRWYYRRTFAKILVDKPMDDAFKNGFAIKSRNAQELRNLLKRTNWAENYRMAQQKARRDGFALLFIGVRSSADVSKPPENAREITHTDVWTIDDLDGDVSKHVIKNQLPSDAPDEIEVRETGIVVNKDPNSRNFNDPIGYVLNSGQKQFVHASRVQHFTWNPQVDGDYDRTDYDNSLYFDKRSTVETLGRWEGDSVLMPSYDLLKWMKKGNWSIMQSVFRYASKMYAVKLPDDANEQELVQVDNALKNMNSKSELILPSTGYEIEDFDTDGQMEPREYFDVVFEQICAGQEMTKSVLFGTQQGTVTGSETDIKNYFNKVQRMRKDRVEGDMKDFVETVANYHTTRSQPLISNFAQDFEIEWEPLFKLSEADRMELKRTQANALTMLVGQYALTPDEVRSILSEEWAEVDLDDLTEDQMDMLDRINLSQVGAYEGAENAEAEMEGNPRMQNGGGRQQGQNSESNNPTADEGRVSIEETATQTRTDTTNEGVELVKVTVDDTPGDAKGYKYKKE